MTQYILFIVPVFTFLLGLFVVARPEKSGINKLFFCMTTSMAVWMVFNIIVDMVAIDLVLLMAKFDFGLALIMVYFFMIFCLNFPSIKKGFTAKALVYSILPILLYLVVFLTKAIVAGVTQTSTGYEIDYGILEYFYDGVIIAYVINGIVGLFMQYKRYSDLEKNKIIIMFVGLLIMALVVTGLNLFGSNLFPGYATINRFGLLGFVVFISFTAYAIVAKHLFDIKVILTETATILVALAVFVQTLLSKTYLEGILNGIILILVTYGGYLIIRSVQKEIKQKEQLQELSTQLEQANAHLKELDAMKTEFVSLASHELLTPVSAIEGYLSMLLDEKMARVDDPKALKYLNNVYSSAKRLARLIADMLNISRIEEGRLLVEKADVDMKKLIEDVVDEVKFKADERKQKVVFALESQEYFMSYGDADKIKEVAINIIGNSIKYSRDPGTITVTVKIAPTEQVKNIWSSIKDEIKARPLDDQESIKSAVDEHYRELVGAEQLMISVKDEGIGIPVEELPRLFKKFHRVGNYSTQESQGTGLGLYISRALTELQHGRIWADSEGEGKGSTFTFTLPTIAAKEEIIAMEKEIKIEKEQLKPLAKPMKMAEEL